MSGKKFRKQLKGVLDKVHLSNWEFVKLGTTVVQDLRKDLKVFSCNIADLSLLPTESDTTTFGILILYPEICITNSRGDKHTIKELYILLPFVRQAMLQARMFRVSGTYNEIHQSYLHSHTSSHFSTNNRLTLSSFCTNGESIAPYVQKKGDEFMSDMEFEHFLYTLEQFLSWESLEGTPYKCMVDVNYEYHGLELTKILNSSPKFAENLHKYCSYTNDSVTGEIRVLYSNVQESVQHLSMPQGEYRDGVIFVKRNYTAGISEDRMINTDIGRLHIETKVFPNIYHEIERDIVDLIKQFTPSVVHSIEQKFENALNKTAIWLRSF